MPLTFVEQRGPQQYVSWRQGLGRYQQAKNALLGVAAALRLSDAESSGKWSFAMFCVLRWLQVAADAKDVEALCALAYLESKPDQAGFRTCESSGSCHYVQMHV